MLGVWAPLAGAAIHDGGQSANRTGAGAATSLVLSKPSTAKAGDVLIASMTVRNDAVTLTAPSGRTVIDNATRIGIRQATYSRVATASEPASWSWTLSASTSASGAILRHSEVHITTPLDTTAVGVNGDLSTPTVPSLTTVTAGAKVIRLDATDPSWATFATNPPTLLVSLSRLQGALEFGVSGESLSRNGRTERSVASPIVRVGVTPLQPCLRSRDGNTPKREGLPAAAESA